jgi:hypothetical protein
MENRGETFHFDCSSEVYKNDRLVVRAIFAGVRLMLEEGTIPVELADLRLVLLAEGYPPREPFEGVLDIVKEEGIVALMGIETLEKHYRDNNDELSDYAHAGQQAKRKIREFLF